MIATATIQSITFKVLIIGSFGIGKTTLIEQISDVPVVGTEVATSGEEAEIKPTTTVGVEYGLYSLSGPDYLVTLLLFGTPGQARFNAARDVASQGIDGLIVIVDGDAPSTWPIGRQLYADYNPLQDTPTLVIVNRWPQTSALPSGLEKALDLPVQRASLSSGNVNDRQDARRFLVDLLSMISLNELGDEGTE